jgi:hypothetical protein
MQTMNFKVNGIRIFCANLYTRTAAPLGREEELVVEADFEEHVLPYHIASPSEFLFQTSSVTKVRCTEEKLGLSEFLRLT